MPLPIKLQRCVVFFGLAPDRGQPLPQVGSTYAGTGFVVSLPTLRGRFSHNYLVTNAHVAKELESRPTAFVRVNVRGGGSQAVWLDGQVWTRHTRSEVDIAVIRPDFRKFPAWRDLDVDAVSSADFLPPGSLDNVSLGVGDPIHVPGLLRAAPGATRNMPLVRSGTLAALAAEPVEVRRNVFEPVHLGMIQSVGGMSGSPTFIEYRPVPFGIIINPNKSWGHLLGINAGHFLDVADGTSTGQINAGVNVIYPVERLVEILALPEVEVEQMTFEDALQTAYPEQFQDSN